MQKLAVRDYIRQLGVPHTFIDVGWWMQLFLPLPARSRAREGPLFKGLSQAVYGSTGGENKVLLTDLRHIGTYVARVLADERTLNRAVIVWEDERRQREAHEVGERVSGEGEYLRAQRRTVGWFLLFLLPSWMVHKKGF